MLKSLSIFPRDAGLASEMVLGLARDFVLVDAIHGREEDILEELDEIEDVIAARDLPPRVTNNDILVLAEGETQNDIMSLLGNQLSRVDGVDSVRKDYEGFVDDELEIAMDEMKTEASQT